RLQDALIGFYYRLSRYLDYLAYQEQFKDVAFFETLRIEIGRYAQRLNQAIRQEDALEVNGADCNRLINFLNAKPDVRLSFGEQRGLQSLYKEYAPEGGKWANDILEIAEYLTLHNFVAAFRYIRADNPWLVKPSDNPNVAEDGSGRIATMALSLLSSGDYNAGEPGHESFYCVRTQALKGDTAKDKFAVALNKVKEMFSDIVIGGSRLSLNINNQEIPLSDLITDGRLNFVTDKKPCCAKQDMGVTMPVESVYPVYIRLGRKIIGTVFVIDVAQFIQGLKDSGVKQDNYPRPFVVNYHGRDIYFCLMIDATPGGVEMGDGVVEPIGQEEAKKAKADKKYKPKFKLSAPTVWQMAAVSRLKESAREELGGAKEELARLREILKQIEEKRLNGQGIWWLYLKAQICSKLLLPLSGGIHFMGRYLHKVPLVKEVGAMYATPTSCSTNGASYFSLMLSSLFGFGRSLCALLGTTLHMYTSDGQKGPFGHLCARSTGAAEGVKQNLDIIALFTALRTPVAMVDGRVVVMGGSVFDFVFQTPYPVPKEMLADYLVRVGQEFPDVLRVFTKADAKEGVYRWKDTISGQRTGSIVYLDTLVQINPNTFRILVAYDNEMSFSYKMHEFIEALFLARQRQKHKRRRAQARREEAARFATPRGQFEAAKNIRSSQPELAASHEQMGNTLLRINKYLSKRGRIHVSPKDFALAEIDNDNRVRWRIALPELRRIITEEPKGPRLTLAAAENVIRYIEKILSPVEEEAHFVREGLSAVEGVVKEPPCSSVQEAFARAQKGAPEPPGYWTKAMVACNSRGMPLGVIESGDTVKVFDHRADRIRALAKVLVDTLFNKFRTKKDLKVNLVPLTPYDPELFRELGIEPVFSDEELYEDVTNTATDVWEGAGKTVAFIAETEKFTHVTYYFWGGKDRKLKYGYTVMVPSNSIQDHSKKPEMKAKEITDVALDCMYGRNGMKKADVIVMNYANMDILKHTGNHKAMVKAAETIDKNLGRILPAVDETQGFAIITADHGAGEETKELDERGNFILDPKTGKPIPAVCHSYGTKVPFIVYGFGRRGGASFNLRDGGSVANVIPTMLALQGISKPREMVESLIEATGKLPAKSGPALLIIRDGYGIRKFDTADARACDATLEAKTPVDDMLRRDYPNTVLLSHGEAVGLPDGYMGDSDVCHKIIGAGRVIEAPISRINKSIKSGEYFRREQNVGPVRKARDAGKSVVLVGLVSEGGVHSHFNTLLADLELCRREGVQRIKIICIHDCRDVSLLKTAEYYYEMLERKITQLGLQDRVVIITQIGRGLIEDRDAINKMQAANKELLRYLKSSLANGKIYAALCTTVIGKHLSRLKNGFISDYQFTRYLESLTLEELLMVLKALRSSGAVGKIEGVTRRSLKAIEDNLRASVKLWRERIEPGYRAFVFGEGIRYIATPLAHAAPAPATKTASAYGPHPTQEGLRPLYEKVAAARQSQPDDLRIVDILAFPVQKHGAKATDAISFACVLESGPVIEQAGVMGGISAGEAEPGTHPNIAAAIEFFNTHVRKHFKGLNVASPDDITKKIVELDEAWRKEASDKDKPRFSYIGAEIAIGISMVASIALAERLGVPLEVTLNYRYNEYCLTHGLAKELQPITIPVDYSVVWEGGKHGAAKYLPELVKEGIIKDDSLFPARFKDKERIAKGDKTIMLAMVPPQELQIIVFAHTWRESYEIGKRLTLKYQELLRTHGVDVVYGAESGCTTKQLYTKDKRLVTLELVLDILNEATDFLGADAKYVRYALDIASSEMYIPEIDRYYIGPAAAGNDSGLVDNAGFTKYKLELFKKYPRFISCEDWADENKPEHWESAKQIMDQMKMINMGDDNTVSLAKLIRKFTELLKVINAHLQKPNQSAEELAMIEAVGTSHSLNNVVVFSHRGTRPELETYTAITAMAMGGFGCKFTLWGVGRGGLIAAINQADEVYNRGPYKDVTVPYQGALVLDPNGPYKDYGFAQRIREEIKAAEAKPAAPESGAKPVVTTTEQPIADREEQGFRVKFEPVARAIYEQLESALKKGVPGNTPMISLDGGSGADRPGIADAIAKYLKEHGFETVIIPSNICLKNRLWRLAVQKLVTGRELNDEERALLGDLVKQIQPRKPYLKEEEFFDNPLILTKLEEVDKFRRSGQQSFILRFPDAFDPKTKKIVSRAFEIKKGMVIIFDGKYANREELQKFYDLRYRLHDDPHLTEERFRTRTKLLSPQEADLQIDFYGLSLFPSYQAYDKRTEGEIDGFLELRNEGWNLVTGSKKEHSPVTLDQTLQPSYENDRAHKTDWFEVTLSGNRPGIPKVIDGLTATQRDNLNRELPDLVAHPAQAPPLPLYMRISNQTSKTADGKRKYLFDYEFRDGAGYITVYPVFVEDAATLAQFLNVTAEQALLFAQTQFDHEINRHHILRLDDKQADDDTLEWLTRQPAHLDANIAVLQRYDRMVNWLWLRRLNNEKSGVEVNFDTSREIFAGFNPEEGDLFKFRIRSNIALMQKFSKYPQVQALINILSTLGLHKEVIIDILTYAITPIYQLTKDKEGYYKEVLEQIIGLCKENIVDKSYLPHVIQFEIPRLIIISESRAEFLSKMGQLKLELKEGRYKVGILGQGRSFWMNNFRRESESHTETCEDHRDGKQWKIVKEGYSDKCLEVRAYQRFLELLLAASTVLGEPLNTLDIVSCEPVVFYGGKIEYSEDRDYVAEELLQIWSQTIFRSIIPHVNITSLPNKKCIVLDCDGVLWDGVIGEDGVEGIKITPAHLDFQRSVKALKGRGIILAINSKNNPEDVARALEHPVMILRRGDFSVVKANWQDKATNMRAVAQELNIGIDSLVFLDDSAHERELVRTSCPEVLTPDLPENPAERTKFLDDLRVFNQGAVTGEDRRRTELYDARRQREEARAQTASLEQFYRSLEMRVVIREGEENLLHISRLAQLTQRSNQFNLTREISSESSIQSFLRSSDYRVYSLELTDKFGNHGIVGLIILRRARVSTWSIDVFCMSCRAIGLTLEQAFVAYVLDRIRETGAKYLEGIYKPGPKNSMVKDLYKNLGFEPLSDLYYTDWDFWRIDIEKSTLKIPEWVSIVTQQTQVNETKQMRLTTSSPTIDELISQWFEAAKRKDLSIEKLKEALEGYLQMCDEETLREATELEIRYVGLETKVVSIEGSYETTAVECSSLHTRRCELIAAGYEILDEVCVDVDHSNMPHIYEMYEISYAKAGCAKAIRCTMPLYFRLPHFDYKALSAKSQLNRAIKCIYEICIVQGKQYLLRPSRSQTVPHEPILNEELSAAICKDSSAGRSETSSDAGTQHSPATFDPTLRPEYETDSATQTGWFTVELRGSRPNIPYIGDVLQQVFLEDRLPDLVAHPAQAPPLPLYMRISNKTSKTADGKRKYLFDYEFRDGAGYITVYPVFVEDPATLARFFNVAEQQALFFAYTQFDHEINRHHILRLDDKQADDATLDWMRGKLGDLQANIAVLDEANQNGVYAEGEWISRLRERRAEKLAAISEIVKNKSLDMDKRIDALEILVEAEAFDFIAQLKATIIDMYTTRRQKNQYRDRRDGILIDALGGIDVAPPVDWAQYREDGHKFLQVLGVEHQNRGDFPQINAPYSHNIFEYWNFSMGSEYIEGDLNLYANDVHLGTGKIVISRGAIGIHGCFFYSYFRGMKISKEMAVRMYLRALQIAQLLGWTSIEELRAYFTVGSYELNTLSGVDIDRIESRFKKFFGSIGFKECAKFGLGGVFEDGPNSSGKIRITEHGSMRIGIDDFRRIIAANWLTWFYEDRIRVCHGQEFWDSNRTAINWELANKFMRHNDRIALQEAAKGLGSIRKIDDVMIERVLDDSVPVLKPPATASTYPGHTKAEDTDLPAVEVNVAVENRGERNVAVLSFTLPDNLDAQVASRLQEKIDILQKDLNDYLALFEHGPPFFELNLVLLPRTHYSPSTLPEDRTYLAEVFEGKVELSYAILSKTQVVKFDVFQHDPTEFDYTRQDLPPAQAHQRACEDRYAYYRQHVQELNQYLNAIAAQDIHIEPGYRSDLLKIYLEQTGLAWAPAPTAPASTAPAPTTPTPAAPQVTVTPAPAPQAPAAPQAPKQPSFFILLLAKAFSPLRRLLSHYFLLGIITTAVLIYYHKAIYPYLTYIYRCIPYPGWVLLSTASLGVIILSLLILRRLFNYLKREDLITHAAFIIIDAARKKETGIKELLGILCFDPLTKARNYQELRQNITTNLHPDLPEDEEVFREAI
ncbi:MAG: HAD-IIIC family phosphatase, partial [Bacteroidales bacterium]